MLSRSSFSLLPASISSIIGVRYGRSYSSVSHTVEKFSNSVGAPTSSGFVCCSGGSNWCCNEHWNVISIVRNSFIGPYQKYSNEPEKLFVTGRRDRRLLSAVNA